jgi:hypothetical protein
MQQRSAGEAGDALHTQEGAGGRLGEGHTVRRRSLYKKSQGTPPPTHPAVTPPHTTTNPPH